jgi:tetratricopeptide (TPR) repeat protein
MESQRVKQGAGAAVLRRLERSALPGLLSVRTLTAVLFLVASSAGAHEHTGGLPTPAELGSVSFQTSCKPDVQADFNRGVALIHSFWHEEARRTFDGIVKADPDCAIAYWGQAMASFHFYSGTQTAADLSATGAALEKADTASKKSAREAAYIAAMHRLYEVYKPSDLPEFARRFAEAIRGVVSRFPEDVDAKAFYALALLASVAPGDQSLSKEKEAVAVMAPALRQHPDHPGLVHYTIHACDHPNMARQGLAAARRYAALAPAAPHALHMPSHIFARLGMWEEDIRSNLASKAASEDTSGAHIGAENRLHAMEFLEYAYLQSGRFEEARMLVAEARTVKSADTNYADYYLTVQARFGLLLAVETQDWEMAARLETVPDAHWFSEAQTLLARAMAAGHLRDARIGVTVAKAFDDLLVKAKVPPLAPASSSSHLHDEIFAWTSFAQGDSRKALTLLRPVAERQSKVGKGEVELPAREMLADMLLLDHRPAEALEEYQLSLRTDPNRFNGLIGAARAAEQAGRGALATKFYRTLAANCPSASGTAREMLSRKLTPG